MRKIKKIKRREYKVALAFGSCLLVALVTLVGAMEFSKKKLVEEAYRTAEVESSSAELYSNTLFASAEWAIYSFLTSIADCENVSNEKGEYQYSRSILRRFDCNRLERNEIFDMISAYAEYNDYINSCILIFQPGVLSKIPEGIAAAAYSFPNKGQKVNLLEEYDMFGSKFYQYVKATGQKQVVVNRVGQDQRYVFTFGVPLFDGETREIVGQCWVDISMEVVSERLSEFKFDDDFVTFLMTGDGYIISSSDTLGNDRYIKEVLEIEYQDSFPQDWYDGIREALDTREKASGAYTAGIDDLRVRTYWKKLENTDVLFVNVKSESNIIRMAVRLQRTLLVIFIAAFLLFASCLLYLFYAFRKENRAKDRLRGELKLAYQIQHRLLTPNPAVEPDGYDVYGYQQPARSVGGDLFCHFEKEGKLYFCIGDVSGKGVSAALLMTEIVSLYRYVAGKKDDVADIVRVLNDSSMDDSVNRNICTMFAGILDLETGHVDFCNAGHNPPLVVSGSQARYISMKPNMPLYAFDGYPYAAESLDLAPGDSLVLYTDGVTDAMDSKGRMFGQDAFLSEIRKDAGRPFPEIVERLDDRISDFVGDMDQYDDVTLLCIKYKGKQ